MKKTQPGRNGGTLKADAGPGRPAGSLSLKGMLKKALKDNPDLADQLIAATIQAAISGASQDRKLVFDLIDGPLAEQLNVNVTGLTESERAERLAVLLGTARDRRDRQSAGDVPN